MIDLYDYQVKAIEKLETGKILCGGVGSGKSRTALAYYFKVNGGDLNGSGIMTNPSDLYIITTAMKRDSLEWEDEMRIFLMSTNPEVDAYDHKVVVDSWNNIKKYEEVKDTFFIFDEQRVVGKGQWAKSFIKISKSNDWILLSATPGDTWMDYVSVFIANGFFRNRTEFYQNHVIFKPFSNYAKVERYWNTGRLIRLRNRILIDMDFERETQSHHININCDYPKIEYRLVLKERWDLIKDKPIETASELCIALRRIVNSDVSRTTELQKIAAEKNRIIVFYNFDYELDILKNLDYGSGFEIAEWNGHKHEPIPEGMQWIYLVQYNAGAEGWNCIRTDTMVFYSQNYSYKMTEQAAGRIDRLNTPYHDLYFYHFKSKAGIDLAIAKALSEKRNFNENRFIRTV